MPDETVPVVLKFNGPDVDQGSMSVQDMIPVLEGFSSAYAKLAAEFGASDRHRIRITGVTKSSANILLEIWEAVQSDPLRAIEMAGGSAAFIVVTILGVIRLKRHTRGQPFRDEISGNNSVTITNSENVQVQTTLNVYQVFKEKVIDRDVAKIASPLEAGRIDSAEISTRDSSGRELTERIESDERRFFDVELVTVTQTQEAWFVVRLNSLTKSTDSGFLHMVDGSRVFYEYKGPAPRVLHEMFAHDGPVRIRAVAHLDESAKPRRMEIFAIERAQGELFPSTPEGQ